MHLILLGTQLNPSVHLKGEITRACAWSSIVVRDPGHGKRHALKVRVGLCSLKGSADQHRLAYRRSVMKAASRSKPTCFLLR